LQEQKGGEIFRKAVYEKLLEMWNMNSIIFILGVLQIQMEGYSPIHMQNIDGLVPFRCSSFENKN
jgi:hypothetical protein